LLQLAGGTGYMGTTSKRSITGSDLNLPYADLNGHVKTSRGTRIFLNKLVWENSYTQVVNNPNRDAFLDVYFDRPKVRSLLRVMFRSGITAGYYWK